MSVIYDIAATEEQTFETFASRVNEIITAEELDVMKQHVRDCLGYDLTDIQTFRQLIHALIGKKQLSRSNLALLKEMLFRLGRKDLIKLAIEDSSLQSKARQTKYAIEGRESVSITVRIEFLSCADDHVHELLRRLAGLVFAPVNCIQVNRIEQLSAGGVICVLDIDKVYADILQDNLEYTDGNNGLNYCGVTDIFIYNTAYKIRGKMVPFEMLQEHQRVIVHLNRQNLEFMQRLDQLGKSLDSLLPLVAELGDPKTHLKNLEYLHKHSGMSTTLWKVLGKLSDDQLPDKYKPDFSQEVLRQKCLYSKARMLRVFPNLSRPLEKKPTDNKETNTLKQTQPNEDGKKMISQLQRQVAQQDQQIKMMERELLLIKRTQNNALNSTDLSRASEVKGMKRKYLPEQMHEEQFRYKSSVATVYNGETVRCKSNINIKTISFLINKS